MEITIKTLNIAGMTDKQIGERLREIGEDFPYSGDNYDEQVLEEALKRVRALQ